MILDLLVKEEGNAPTSARELHENIAAAYPYSKLSQQAIDDTLRILRDDGLIAEEEDSGLRRSYRLKDRERAESMVNYESARRLWQARRLFLFPGS